MRFLHTADWHLGRLFHGFHLTEDQAYVLEQFIELAREEGPDAIVIAGDVYDRAVPPPEAVSLLDHVLSELTLGLGIPVLLVAGNHDSPERLAFGRRVLEGGRLHVRGTASAGCRPVVVDDGGGAVYLCPLPFLEPARAREAFGNPELLDHHAALAAYAERLRAQVPEGARTVAVAHAFVAGALESDSERPLSVGTSGLVQAAVFEDFDYAALGHLHRPQRAGGERIRYAGSLLKYSLSEADHRKSVTLVEVSGSGPVRVEEIELRPRRDLRVVEGVLEELLAAGGQWGPRDDYLYVRLLDRGALLEPVPRLREVFPNLIGVERAHAGLGGSVTEAGPDVRALDEVGLFADFFGQVTGEPLSPAERQVLEDVAGDLRQGEREAS